MRLFSQNLGTVAATFVLPVLLRALPWSAAVRMLRASGSCEADKGIRADGALEFAERLWRIRGMRRWANCLTRSVIRQRLLRRAGRTAALHIGLRKEAGVWSGHAWVTIEGAPCGDDDADVLLTYTETLRISTEAV